MARVEFTTFKEASVFSKQLSATTNSVTTIHREANMWWVEDPGAEKANKNQNIISDKPGSESDIYEITATQIGQINEENATLLQDGYDIENNTFVLKVLGAAIESEEHREIVFKYWTWLRSLANGSVSPDNEAQRMFIHNIKSNNITDVYEYVCIHYKAKFDINLEKKRTDDRNSNSEKAKYISCRKPPNIYDLSSSAIGIHNITDGE